ncbi:MAG: M20/M25/M40 family metallo-hydrolase [Candidatus Acidiferrum sp.]
MRANRYRKGRFGLAAICLLAAGIAGSSQGAFGRISERAPGPTPRSVTTGSSSVNPEAHDIFKQLVEINTTNSSGNVTAAAEAMAKRLLEAGFAENDVLIAGPNERKKNLVARIHGMGKQKAILFLGHLDVVEAKREDWSTDPFQLVEHDGYFYGRGAEDMKAADAILVNNFIRLKSEGFRPDRDIILALTADEEGGDYNGVDWLLKQHREWIDAEYCINLDAGEFGKQGGRRVSAAMQVSEKVYADYQLESLSTGGHSAEPGPDNAIYRLAGALTRLQSFSFPFEVNQTTRIFFQQMAAIAPEPAASDFRGVAKQPPDAAAAERLSATPYFNSLLRTTCVATMLSGGHAPNALPQSARATINCRLFPGRDTEDVRQAIERAVANFNVSVRMVKENSVDGKRLPAKAVPPSPVVPEVVNAVAKILRAKSPNLPVLTMMSAGASDGKFTRAAGIPTYGISCIFFEQGENRAHGKDERVGIQDFYDGVEFNYELIRALARGR